MEVILRKLFCLLLLPLFFAGCLTTPPPAPVVVEPVPAPPVADVVLNGFSPALVALLSADDLVVGLVADEEDAADFSLLTEMAETEFLDAETLDDNLLLSVTGELAPEDEGQTSRSIGVSDDFPVVYNAKVQYFIDYYTGRGRQVFARWLERSTRYLPQMREIFAEEGLPRDLAYLAMVESGFNVKAYSWAHAVGPWQFIQGTGRMMKMKTDWWYDERRDFDKSSRAAARYLKDLNTQFNGEWYLAVAAYNAGPGKVRSAVRKTKSTDFWVLSRTKHLRAETRDYVPKLMAALTIARDPESYGFTDLAYQQPYDYETVVIPSVTDLDIVARLTGATYEEIKELNPELKRWCTPPGVDAYRLRIPAGTSESFLDQYAQLAKADRANYMHYRIRSGDTLLAIAQKHNIRVADIVSLNSIRNPRSLRIGTDLVLPLKKGYTHRPIDELKDDFVRSRRQVYTVRNGDSLWSISQRFGVSEQQLRVWNRLGWSNIIRPGQKLLVSSKSAKTAKKSVAKPSAAKEGTHKIIYRVQPGDTLWGIGQQFSVATAAIRDWNNLSAQHVLHPGDELTLHVRTSTQRG
jgi:membrane-bound lytic murein transglycosylase D